MNVRLSDAKLQREVLSKLKEQEETKFLVMLDNIVLHERAPSALLLQRCLSHPVAIGIATQKPLRIVAMTMIIIPSHTHTQVDIAEKLKESNNLAVDVPTGEPRVISKPTPQLDATTHATQRY